MVILTFVIVSFVSGTDEVARLDMAQGKNCDGNVCWSIKISRIPYDKWRMQIIYWTRGVLLRFPFNNLPLHVVIPKSVPKRRPTPE